MSSKAPASSTIEAEAPLELLTKAKPESGTLLDASRLVVADCRATLFLRNRFIGGVRLIQVSVVDGVGSRGEIPFRAGSMQAAGFGAQPHDEAARLHKVKQA